MCKQHDKKIKFRLGISILFVFLSISGTLFALDPGALPTGGKITSGKGSISTTGNQMTVQQSTQKMIAGWDTFNIGSQAGVTFRQPNANSVALNRINDQNPSQILGSLSSNGRIYLINPSGIVFGDGSQVNVGGLIASSLNISDEDFLNRKDVFTNDNSAGSILNQGNISVIPGGVVAFIGPSVINKGTIDATKGDVILAAGDQVTLNLNRNGLIGYTVDKGAIGALASNSGLIQADGGQVVLTAKAADSLTSAVVNNSGVIAAQTLKNKGGRIMLMSDMENGQTVVSGTLDASAPNGGDGGFIETSAANVKVNENAVITTAAPKGETGTWEIDPYDFTIAPSGGDITGAAVTAALANNSVTIQTLTGSVTCSGVSCGTATATGNGDIFVNDNITWTKNTLTLNAYRNIAINQELFGSGTAKLALLYGQGTTGSYTINAPVNLPAGSNFSSKSGSAATVSYTVITSLGAAGSSTGTDLQGMSGFLARNYVLGANIDASTTSTWNSNMGFLPIGNNATQFTGQFDGLGHTISNLYINRTYTTSNSTNYVGLFGYSGGSVRNIGMVGGSVSASSSVTGNKTITTYIGSLVGLNSGTITNSYTTGSVSGSTSGTSNSNTKTVHVGGLAGSNSGTITNSYATGSVNGSFSGSGNKTTYVGGLAGSNSGTITNSYATGRVGVSVGTGTINVGGLVGSNNSGGNVANTYSTGLVSSVAGTTVGGLMGNNAGTVTSSYWDTTTSGSATGIGGGTTTGATGLTTAQMMQSANFSGWDFTNTWWLSAGNTRPFLRSEWSTTIVNAHQLQLMALDLTKSYTLGADISMSELSSASGLWNTGMGFVPVGNKSTPFTGTFDGQNKTITDLVISRSGEDYVGLFGYIGSGGTVSNVGLVNGSVQGRNDVGQLAGFNLGTITKGYTTGSVSGNWGVGGLVGFNAGTITKSYATGNVSGTNDVGGLAGGNYGSIANTYAWGEVTGSSGAYYVSALVGYIAGPGTVSYSYAMGAVFGGKNDIGGLIGGSRGSTTNSYWDAETTGQTFSAGGAGKTDTQMKTASTYTGWDTASIWNIVDGNYPTLK